MKTLNIMLLKLLIPTFIVFLSFFILVFQLIDVFTNIWRYINNEVSLANIGYIALLYMPKCISYSLPVAFLFAISFSLGSLYDNNEMLAVFGSGINLYKFVLPLIILGLILSVGAFIFEDKVVIYTLREKNETFRRVLNLTENYSRNNVTIISADNKIIYNANFYDDQNELISGLSILERDENNNPRLRIDALTAKWNGTNWVLRNCDVYTFTEDGAEKTTYSEYDELRFRERPEFFRKITRNVDEMEYVDAKEYIESIKNAGIEYSEPLSEYYKKFSFSFICLIVALISSSVGSYIKKNVVLISLLISLGIVVIYYVFQLMTMAMARTGNIYPVLGAWSPFVVFLFVGFMLFKYART